MSDAEKIIGKLEARYRCPVHDCGGVVQMTMDPPGTPGDRPFYYACNTCGGQWTQDGKPRHRIVDVASVRAGDD